MDIMPPPARKHDSSAGRPSRRQKSCEGCRARKMKCSRTANCAACVMRGEECVWLHGLPVTATSQSSSELSTAQAEIARLRKLVDVLMVRIEGGKGAPLSVDVQDAQALLAFANSPTTTEAEMNAAFGYNPLQQPPQPQPQPGAQAQGDHRGANPYALPPPAPMQHDALLDELASRSLLPGQGPTPSPYHPSFGSAPPTMSRPFPPHQHRHAPYPPPSQSGSAAHYWRNHHAPQHPLYPAQVYHPTPSVEPSPAERAQAKEAHEARYDAAWDEYVAQRQAQQQAAGMHAAGVPKIKMPTLRANSGIALVSDKAQGQGQAEGAKPTTLLPASVQRPQTGLGSELERKKGEAVAVVEAAA